MKTRKTLVKRFKLSHPKRGKSKIMHNTKGINHLTGKRTSNRQGRNNHDKVLDKGVGTKMRKLISPSNI